MDDLFDYALGILRDLLEVPEKVLEWTVSLIAPSSFLIALIVIGAILQAIGFELLGLAFVKTQTFVSDITTRIGLLLIEPAIVVYVIFKILQPLYSAIKDII